MHGTFSRPGPGGVCITDAVVQGGSQRKVKGKPQPEGSGASSGKFSIRHGKIVILVRPPSCNFSTNLQFTPQLPGGLSAGCQLLQSLYTEKSGKPGSWADPNPWHQMEWQVRW